MKPSTKDKTEGTYYEIQGKIKEGAGKISGDKELEREGTAEKIAGKVQKKRGEIEKVFGK